MGSRSSGHLLRSLVCREVRGRWCPGPLGGPRFHLDLTEETLGHVFLGFLSGSDVIVSYRCVLSSAEPEPDGDLALADGALSLHFWHVWPSAPNRLAMAPLWERDVLEQSELLSQFQPRLLFYEFPRANRFLAFFVWDLYDRRRRHLWHVRLLSGTTPSGACSSCRSQRARESNCPSHSLVVMSEFRVKSGYCSDIRRCLRPLSPSCVLVLRPHKGLVTVVSFDFLSGPPASQPHLRLPSFGAPPKLHFGGCTEGVCSRCYQAWACSYRAVGAARLYEGLPNDPCALSARRVSRKRPSTALEPSTDPVCSSCGLSNELRNHPACLDLVVNVSGLVDSHDRSDRAADGLTCPVVRSRLLAESYGHWLKRRCRLRESDRSTVQLEPRLLSRAPHQQIVCSPMPWLLMNSERCLSYATEVCYPLSKSPRQEADLSLIAEDCDFYDLPLVSAGLHLQHLSTFSQFASVLRPALPEGPACRLEELVLALRPLLHRRFRLDPFGKEPNLEIVGASRTHVTLHVSRWDWREGRGIIVLWNLETGHVETREEEWQELHHQNQDGRTVAWEELTVAGRSGSNVTFLPELGARRLEYFPETLDSAESMAELFDDSGLFCVRKAE